MRYNMYDWAKDLFPICRSITGQGVRDTLKYIKTLLPDLEIKSIESGTKCFDWVIPQEWSIKNAYLENEFGERIIDFKDSNLHVVGYSEPVDEWFSFEEIQNFIYSLEDQPKAIPYVTSYYSKNFGFCMSHEKRKKLKNCKYHAFIDSEKKNGVLNYGELLIKGKKEKEILLSTYICHPSLANDNLSGIVVTSALAMWIKSLKQTEYSFRIIFIPETIGSIAYISQNLEELKNKIHAGFNVTCVGDDKNYSFLPSRNGNTIADKAGMHILNHAVKNYTQYSWLDRGSDERQFCSPGVDLPVVSIMRSKYGEFPEYHTSRDNLEFISQKGLQGAFSVIKETISAIDKDFFPKLTLLCEPKMSERGLYPKINSKDNHSYIEAKTIMNLISYCDGRLSLIEIGNLINQPFNKLIAIAEKSYIN